MPPDPEEVEAYYSRAEVSSHAARVERLREDASDRMYEDDLRACNAEGHEPAICVCPRCGEVLG